MTRTYEVLANQYAQNTWGYAMVPLHDPVADSEGWPAEVCGYIPANLTQVNIENAWIGTPGKTQDSGNGLATAAAIGGLLLLGFQIWDEVQKHSRN